MGRLAGGSTGDSREPASLAVVDAQRGRVAQEGENRRGVVGKAVEAAFLEPLGLLGPERSPPGGFLDGQLALEPERRQRSGPFCWFG
jgi:hypothetical protein